MTYLTRDESRPATRGTEMQKDKRRVSIVMCVNADSSNVLPVSYVGTASNPKCFQDARFVPMKQNYWSQSNGWMDSKGFLQWIHMWYEEAKKLSNGPLLLVMDNCGGHELSITLNGVAIEFLPPRSTTKHQSLDLGLISSAKILNRTRLLREVLDVMDLKPIQITVSKKLVAMGKGVYRMECCHMLLMQ